MHPKIGTSRTVMLAWRQYLPFSMANVHAHAPQRAGVYKIAVNLVNGKKRVVYVLHFRPSCNTQVPTGPAYLVTPLTSN